jgi:hypothetical protein
MIAAGASRTIHVNGHVPDLGGASPRSEEEAIGFDDATADTGANGDVDEVRASSPRSKLVLGERREVRIIPDLDRNAQLVFEDRLKRDVPPASQIRRTVDHPLAWVDWSRNRDGDPTEIAQWERIEDDPNLGDDATDDRIATFVGESRHGLVTDYLAVRVGQRHS